MVINMDLKELYDSIDDTLTDDNVSKLIEIYSKNGNFYNDLTDNYSKDIPKDINNVFNRVERDKFYANCFNAWKKNIVSMSKEEFKVLLDKGRYNKDFIKLRNYMLKVPDIHSYDEMRKIYYGDGAPKEIQDLLEKYGWDSLGFYSGWTHTDSSYLSARRTNIITLAAMSMADRDDSIPIYSNTEYLLDYIEILNDIKKNNPDLNFYNPPLLTGKINEFIGYGSEPDENIIGNKESFNNLRAKIIEKSIERSRNNWIKNNINTNFGTNERPKSLSHIVSVRAVKDYVRELNERYDRLIRIEQDRRNYSKVYDSDKSIEQFVYEKLHYTPQMINTNDFKDKLYQLFYNSIDNNLRNDTNVKINFNINGRDYNYYQSDLKNTLISFTKTIEKNDSNFKNIVREDIRENSKKYGIMPDKYCFDTTRVQSMIRAYKANKKNSGYKALSDEEIEMSRQKIGTYKEPKPRYTKEEMEQLIMGDSDDGELKNGKVL